MITYIFILLLLFQFKHFVADYPLQNKYMLGKFKDGFDWIVPLAAHAGVHGVFTFTIVILVAPNLWWLSVVDFGCHFLVDRIKASPNLLGRFKALNHRDVKDYLDDLDMCDDEDEIKHVERYWKPRFLSNTLFWWSLGLDQMMHHLTDLFIVYVITTSNV